jgi:hypothetical protein
MLDWITASFSVLFLVFFLAGPAHSRQAFCHWTKPLTPNPPSQNVWINYIYRRRAHRGRLSTQAKRGTFLLLQMKPHLSQVISQPTSHLGVSFEGMLWRVAFCDWLLSQKHKVFKEHRLESHPSL